MFKLLDSKEHLELQLEGKEQQLVGKVQLLVGKVRLLVGKAEQYSQRKEGVLHLPLDKAFRQNQLQLEGKEPDCLQKDLGYFHSQVVWVESQAPMVGDQTESEDTTRCQVEEGRQWPEPARDRQEPAQDRQEPAQGK